MTIKITQIKDRFVVEIPGRNIPHIMTRQSLKSNLKKVFKLSHVEALAIFVLLDDNGFTNQTVHLKVA